MLNFKKRKFEESIKYTKIINKIEKIIHYAEATDEVFHTREDNAEKDH